MSFVFEYENLELKSEHVYANHINSVDSVKFHPTEDTKFASGSHDKTICLWDIQQEKPIASILAQEEGIWSLAWHPNGRSVISTGPAGKIYHTDINTGKCERVIQAKMAKGYYLSFLKDSTDYIICGQNGHIEKYQFGQKTAISSSEVPDKIVYCWKEVADSNKLIASTSNGEFLTFNKDLSDKQTFQMSKHEIRTFEIVKNEIYTGYQNGDLKVINYNIANNEFALKKEFHGHRAPISTIFYDKNNDLLLTGAKDSSIFLWSPQNKKCLHNLVGHKDQIAEISVNCSGKMAVSASWDQTLRSFKLGV